MGHGLMEDNADLYQEALRLFRDLLDTASKSNLREPTAMTLATADASGRPSVRTMLLKGVDERGFLFFTNSQSLKGRELRENPRAALCFFWQPLMRQVRVEGHVETIEEEESDRYWCTRERDSQLGAWASQQSDVLDQRQTLEKQLAEYHDKFLDQAVPRPPYWFGYRVIPERIEFWKSGWHRLHERVRYDRGANGIWRKTLLYP